MPPSPVVATVLTSLTAAIPFSFSDAANARNYPVVMGTVLIMTAFYVTVTIAADLLIARLDPRVRDVFRG